MRLAMPTMRVMVPVGKREANRTMPSTRMHGKRRPRTVVTKTVITTHTPSARFEAIFMAASARPNMRPASCRYELLSSEAEDASAAGAALALVAA